eukprot:c16125_g1_i1.p2 GENE.c16125_g1_i1~~c16125_g1_i1.p2  ORF type:complete len:174 (+),score=57.54 c16125_g1_i1:104-625(+)
MKFTHLKCVAPLCVLVVLLLCVEATTISEDNNSNSALVAVQPVKSLSVEDNKLVDKLAEAVSKNGGNVEPVLTLMRKYIKESDRESAINDITKLRYWDDFGLFGAFATILQFLNRLLHTILNPPENHFTTIHLQEQPWIWLAVGLALVFHTFFFTDNAEMFKDNPNAKLRGFF